MPRTFLRQETQIRNSDAYTDTVASGSTMESAPTHIEDDLNNLRSQVKRILNDSAGNWYDDVPTVNSKQRDLTDLNTDLDDIEEKRLICGVEQLTNVTVPVNVYASGTVTAVAKANIIDGETFVLDDGKNPAVTFEFDTNASVVQTATLRQVDISGDTSAVQVASRMVTAINGAPALDLTAANGGGTLAVVTCTHDKGGTYGNVTTWAETVADAGFTVAQPTGGAGDIVILSQSSSETPSQAAAVGAGTALGAVVAVLSGDVGANDLVEVSSTNPTVPKNRCLVRDAALREGLTSNGHQIYALIQAESGTIDGEAFNDTTKQVQLSFVIIDDTTDDLVPCPGEDIGGQTIEYVYPHRVSLDTLPEDCGFPNFTFTDGSASVLVNLNNAIDNQGVTPATQIQNIDIDMTGAGVEWCWRDALSADLFCIKEGSAGGTSEVQIASDVDSFNVDAQTNDFLQGATFDSGGTSINVGVTAGQIDSAGALSVNSGGGQDLTIQAANEIKFVDTNKSGSTYAGDFLLSATTQEWTDFESAMELIYGSGAGEVSLLKAITGAAQNTRGDQTFSVNTGSAISADTDVGGPSSVASNVDVDFPDMTGGDFLIDYDVYVNGQKQRPGANAAANNDYYPGTNTGGSGVQELKFEFPIRPNDVINVVPYS